MPRPVVSSTRPGALGVTIAALVVAIVTAACGTGGLPATAPPSSALPSSVLTAAPPTPTPVPPTPTPVVLAEPPGAALSGTMSAPDEGAIGSFTWDGAGSDAPWIVPSDASEAAAGAVLDVAFEPAADATSWTARWAPVTAAGAGDVASGVDGDGRVSFTAPADAGSWSLQLQASFGSGRSGTWYWRLEVVP